MSLTKKTQQFNFNFDSISLADLLLLYNHFQIKKKCLPEFNCQMIKT